MSDQQGWVRVASRPRAAASAAPGPPRPGPAGAVPPRRPPDPNRPDLVRIVDTLLEVLATQAAFFEFVPDDVLDPHSCVRQLEVTAHGLQQLRRVDRAHLAARLRTLAEHTPHAPTAAWYRELPIAIGLEDDD